MKFIAVLTTGWTGKDCNTPDCGGEGCWLSEGRGYCDGATNIPTCKCNTTNVSFLEVFQNEKV